MNGLATDPLTTTLRERFALEGFLPGQRRVIEALLAGRPAAAVFPTGGGKSLCYQLPALLLEGVTLVVSPLIALMKDQIDALQRKGIDARRIDSSLSAEELFETMGLVRNGKIRLLYVAPERFNNERFRQAILGIKVALFAVDEAHCISEWGHNFRPDYLKLARFAERCGAERRLALTATATPKVLGDICRALGIAEADAVRTGFYRANLFLRAGAVPRRKKTAELLRRLQERPAGPAIVYVTLQKTAMRVAEALAEAGLPARPYHAGLDKETRSETQEWFLASDQAIVVATIAFGMGIDKPNIRYIYHINLPKSLENLSQEIGRAGRDGQTAICELLASREDLAALENFARGDTPDKEAVQALLDELFCGEQILDVAYYELAQLCDIRPLVVRTLLTYLELDGWLEGGTPRYAAYKLKALKSSAEIFEIVGAERAAFLRVVFRCARKGRTWLTLDADEAARASGSARERVIRAIDWMGERGWFEIKAEKVRHRYRVLRAPAEGAERDTLASELYARALTREQADLARIEEVVGLIEADACQVSRLGEHFGETLAQPCGHCGYCETGQAVELPARKHKPLDESVFAEAQALREAKKALRRPRAFARFLAGIGSPGLTRSRLTRNALFGALRDVSFEELLLRATG